MTTCYYDLLANQKVCLRGLRKFCTFKVLTEVYSKRYVQAKNQSMRIREIINKKTGEKIISFGGEDFENVNPDRHYYDACFVKRMMLQVPDEARGKKKPTEKGKQILLETAKDCREFINSFRAVELPQQLLDLLKAKKKSEQQKLLKNLVLNPDILMGFLLKAGDNGYTLSQYSSEFQPSDIDKEKMPYAYMLNENGEIQKFGKTELTDGQLKQALEQRSVKIAKIIEKDGEWHCFFITFNSIGGKENWRDGQPHFHYISNFFGIKKEDVIEQIKSKKYKLGNLPHITLTDYGVQPNQKKPEL